MTVVPGNIRFVWIFTGFLGDEASNDSNAIKNVDFEGTLGNEANLIIKK